MADPRKFRGVRLSPQGDAYVQLVAARDRTDFSKALRYLLALGARADMENHDDTGTGTRAGRSDQTRHERPADQHGRDRDRDGDTGSGGLPRLPDSGPAGISEALGNLIQGGFRPEAADPDSAA